MEAIVLAGGLGTRLRSIVPDLPKAMAPLAGRPFLEILLNGLAQAGFHKVILALGYKADAIRRHVGDRFGNLRICYEIETAPLGTGGAVRGALTQVESDHVYVFNGDTFLAIEVGLIEDCWRHYREPIVIAREVPDTSRYGRLETVDGHIARFAEKGQGGSGLINAGCYVFPPTLLDAFPVGQPFSLESDFLATAVTHRPYRAFVTQGQFIDIGVPEDYARAQHELAHLVLSR